ncbi:hypothetical protein TorRG33x02_060660 [Trema orientale]|uniref:Uncharacterized protein n=1 Tax=Trema orientale TaxID=63057 RepID=A0A2P5FKE9_TREOI|nr:hypothetical protein TorRG33x02_060660 [Trema orientale]
MQCRVETVKHLFARGLTTNIQNAYLPIFLGLKWIDVAIRNIFIPRYGSKDRLRRDSNHLGGYNIQPDFVPISVGCCTSGKEKGTESLKRSWQYVPAISKCLQWPCCFDSEANAATIQTSSFYNGSARATTV